MHALYVAHATDLGMPDASSCRAALGRCTRLTRLTNRLRQLGTYLGDIITLQKLEKKKGYYMYLSTPFHLRPGAIGDRGRESVPSQNT